MKRDYTEISEWYIQEVYKEMSRRGYTDKQIPYVIGKTRFFETLEKYPEQQLHYSVEDAVDEILFMAAAA